jgi:hypothetical protein
MNPAPRVVAFFVVIVGAIFWFYSRQPLYHTDLWGHLAYGRLIWESGALPATEPFMPLARDVRVVDSAWLSQVAGFLAYSRWGPAAIQFLHALAIAICCGILAQGAYRRTRSVLWSVAGLGLFEALNWFQFRIVRPQMAGLVCCAVLLAVLTARKWRPVYVLAVPAILAVWANLHGSFVVGLGLLGCAWLGRVVDVWRRTASVAAVIRDRRTKRLLLGTVLGPVAALANPYGPRLYAEVLALALNPNLGDLIEWKSLVLKSVQGEVAAGVALGLVVVYGLSRRRVSTGEALAVIGLGAAGFWSARMIVWWTLVAAPALVVRAQSAWRRFRPAQNTARLESASRIWTSTSFALAMVFLVATPFGMQFLSGRAPDCDRSVSSQTPLAATAWLCQHPPVGQVFNVYEWGDYLVWAGPPQIPVFVTSHAHLVPPEVWRDYLTVINLRSGWEDVLERYAVTTVVVDKLRSGALIARLRKSGEWRTAYQDEMAVIFARRESAPGGASR